MKKLGVLVNSHNQRAIDMARDLFTWGRERGAQLFFPFHEAEVLDIQGVSDDEWLDNVDAAIVIGGDGTFLRAGRYVLDRGTPLYGINLGHLGFLAFGEPQDAFHDIEQILNGNFSVFERPTIRADVFREGETIYSFYVLNDIVLSRNISARLMRVEVEINMQSLGTIAADGIIIATPTGSTAYALSAGGPIVPPHVECMIFVPICAHTLYARPIIAGAIDKMTLKPAKALRDVTLTLDGQINYELLPGDYVTTALSLTKTIKSIYIPGRNFIDVMHQKLGWGHSFISEERE